MIIPTVDLKSIDRTPSGLHNLAVCASPELQDLAVHPNRLGPSSTVEYPAARPNP